jgi:hypothetical protein
MAKSLKIKRKSAVTVKLPVNQANAEASGTREYRSRLIDENAQCELKICAAALIDNNSIGAKAVNQRNRTPLQ